MNNNAFLLLNAYQAANLRWLLRMVYEGRAKYLHKDGTEHGCDTGDWCGELLWTLEQEMIDRAMTDRGPNVTSEVMATFEGFYHGLSTAEYAKRVQ